MCLLPASLPLCSEAAAFCYDGPRSLCTSSGHSVPLRLVAHVNLLHPVWPAHGGVPPLRRIPGTLYILSEDILNKCAGIGDIFRLKSPSFSNRRPLSLWGHIRDPLLFRTVQLSVHFLSPFLSSSSSQVAFSEEDGLHSQSAWVWILPYSLLTVAFLTGSLMPACLSSLIYDMGIMRVPVAYSWSEE